MLVFSVLAIERSTTKNETDEHNLHQKNMFNLFSKNPIKALEKEHQRLLVQARDLQRAGDIQAFAAKTAEAETLYEEIQRKKLLTSRKIVEHFSRAWPSHASMKTVASARHQTNAAKYSASALKVLVSVHETSSSIRCAQKKRLFEL